MDKHTFAGFSWQIVKRLKFKESFSDEDSSKKKSKTTVMM